MSNKTSVTVDTGILELLTSKVCHDLISPIGAVNNGIEFLEEMGAEAGEEVTGLIAFSAAQASAKLQVFRMAYGAGGADAAIKPEDVHEAMQAMIGAEKKITQDWDPHGDLGFEDRPDAFAKILMCALLLGIECLPKGGALSVGASKAPGQTQVTAKGENANIRERSASALSLDIPREALEPKYVHAYMTGLLAKTYGYTIAIAEDGEDKVIITLGLPTN